MNITTIKAFIRKHDYLLGDYRFRLREILFSKKAGSVQIEKFPFDGNEEDLPCIEGIFLSTGPNLDYSYSSTRFDIVDFKKRIITRYSIARPYLSKTLKQCARVIQKKDLPKGITFKDFFNDDLKVPHTCHMTPCGKICAVIANFLCFYDTKNSLLKFLPEGFDKKIMLYSHSGGFSKDYEYFYFVRWPFEDSIKILKGEKQLARCEIGRLKLSDQSLEIIYSLDYRDNVHQVSVTQDNRHIIFVNFDFYPYISYLKDLSRKEVEHHIKSGMGKSKMVTFDIDNKKHWETEIPIPTAAHFQFDKIDPSIIYASAHNIFYTKKYGVVVAGYGAIYKMKVVNGKTTILKSYSDEEAIRLTQHVTFVKNGKSYIAATTTPRKFIIVDGETMKRTDTIRIHPDPKVVFKENTFGIYNSKVQFPLALYATEDSRYVIAGGDSMYYVFDVLKHELLDINLFLPHGHRHGHITYVGD